MEHSIRDEAAEALEWVLAANLTAEEWSRADAAVVAAEKALADDDQYALQAATFALDQLLLRVKEKLGQEPTTAPVTDDRRDRMAALVHRMAAGPDPRPGGQRSGRER